MERIPPIVKTLADDKKSITLHIPNVRYAKENDLLIKAKRFKPEEVLKNKEICGFDIVSMSLFKGVQSKIITNCCNINCDGTIEKTYYNYVTNQEILIVNHVPKLLMV
ncbi:hypothetical protein ACIFOT_07050 [Neobacillus sp. NRS-1170]|uniref:hypothetical protein n=1 Tax=Neobacillus sp. NRS-1170 TaxID=3233898 RepID=UPI003D26750F